MLRLPCGEVKPSSTTSATGKDLLSGEPAEALAHRAVLRAATSAGRRAARAQDAVAEADSLLAGAAALAALGEVERSMTGARRARSLFQRTANALGEAQACLLNGLALLSLDRVDEGLEAVTEAAMLLDGLIEASAGRSSAYSSVAGAYAEIEAYEMAHGYNIKATAVGGQSEDGASVAVRHRMATDLAAWGERLAEAGDQAGAHARLREGLSIAQGCLQDPRAVSERLRVSCSLVVGECLLGLGDAAAAAPILEAASARATLDPPLAARAAMRAGIARTQLGRVTAARRHLAVAQSLASAHRLGRIAGQTHLALADLLEREGNLVAAIQEHRSAHRLIAQRNETDRRRRLDGARARARLAKAERDTATLSRLSYEDALTGLGNRRFAQEELPRLMDAARDTGRPLALALVDVDRFKEINDRHSHAAGDDVLRTVAEILKRHCRDGDLVVRYGGDEFLVAFPGLSIADAGRIAERLRTAVEQESWKAIAPGATVTLSIGVATADDLTDPAGLVHGADMHLYAAKREGRNRVRLAA